MNLKPRNSNLIVRRYKRPPESEGGIIIPESWEYDPNKLLWEVVEVGPGYRSKKGAICPTMCRVGDIIHSEDAFSAQPLDGDFKDLYILNEENVSHVVWSEWDD